MREGDYNPAADHLHFVVTGTGHCGTGFIASVMTRLGLNCGHEAIFVPTKSVWWPRMDLVGESSALAAPLLGELLRRNPGVRVFHQVRHPARFVRSMFTARGLFAEQNVYGNFMRYVPATGTVTSSQSTSPLAWMVGVWGFPISITLAWAEVLSSS